MKLRLNTILIAIVLVVLVFFLYAEKRGTYLNGSELQVFLLLVVTLFSLVVNSKLKNELFEILNLVFVAFYICRIPFVFIDGISSYVTQRGVDISLIPWDIFILAYQYFILSICIIAINPKIPRLHFDNGISEFVFVRILSYAFFIIVVNIIMIALSFDLRVQTLSHVPAILKTIFTIELSIMVIILSSFMVEKKTLLKYKFFVLTCVLLAIGCITYQGGKSFVLSIILLMYFAYLVLYGPMAFRLRGLIITMGVGLTALGMYFVGAVFRMYQVGGGPMKSLSEFGFYFNKLFIEKDNLQGLITAISHRMGYLDFYIEKVSNPVYQPYVSFTYYFKALLDKVTPGFDVFGVPFMSRAIYSAFHGEGLVTNSEFVTVFGESYLLLGFFSFCLFIPLLLLIKYVLLRFRTSSGIASALISMYVVYMFYWWLTGMGLDMLVAFIMYVGIFIFSTVSLILYWSRKEKFNSSEEIIVPMN